jgi:quinolinate synthase
MKYNTLEGIYQALLTEQPELLLDEETMIAARKPILRMLELS